MGRILRWSLVVAALLFLAIQAVPYGRRHTNPAARVEPAWDSAGTRSLAARACFDCHSNETTWPWYSHVAPVSWLNQRDVDKGRRKLNFSEWSQPQKEAHESVNTLRRGKMPPWFYAALHPDARLTPAEAQALVQGLEATLGSRGSKRAGRGHDD
jgi:mono/diheme cytochrome c family protein